MAKGLVGQEGSGHNEPTELQQEEYSLTWSCCARNDTLSSCEAADNTLPNETFLKPSFCCISSSINNRSRDSDCTHSQLGILIPAGIPLEAMMIQRQVKWSQDVGTCPFQIQPPPPGEEGEEILGRVNQLGKFRTHCYINNSSKT